MRNLVEIAKSQVGNLGENQKYCLKIPAVISGEYGKSNLGKISFRELISFSGNLGFQIKDVKDGEKIKLTIRN